MHQYKIVVAYDGTGYAGWALQPGKPSILQELEETFARLFKRRIKILGASRTDAGVHAAGQVAVFKSDLYISTEKMLYAWNNALPSKITIRSLAIDDQFHPHMNVKDKTYYYHLFIDRPLPFFARYGIKAPHNINWNAFEKALSLFEGKHNFEAFYTGDDKVNTQCNIKKIGMQKIAEYNGYRIEITGNRFLRHMIRRIIGAALTVATRSTIDNHHITKALQTGKLNCELPTAPAQALLLHTIRYQKKR